MWFRFNLIVIVLVIQQATLADGPALPQSPNDLLAAYERSFDPQKRIAFKAVTRASFEGDFNFKALGGHGLSVAENYYRDRDRVSIWQQSDELDQSGAFLHRDEYRAISGGQPMHFQGDPQHPSLDVLVIERPDDFNARKAASAFGSGRVLNGLCDGDNLLTFSEILHKSTRKIVRPEPEVVDGHKTVVLDAETPYGRYTLWLDPECNYNPRRIEVHKAGKDLFDKRPISEPVKHTLLPPGAISDHPRQTRKEWSLVADKIEILNKDGAFIPVSVSVTTMETYVNGQQCVTKVQHRREDVDLNPNFAALHAFEMSAPDGTPAIFLDDKHPASGIAFVWRLGKIVPAVDQNAVKSIDAQIAGLAQAPSQRPPARTNALWWWVIGALAALLASGLAYRLRSRVSGSSS
jgi:hypothetical protein